jgi:hypothetical protein
MADHKTPHPPTVAQPDSSEDLWLVSYADDDDRELTANQIAAALERGEIDANTIVWRDGMPEWKAIAEVEGLRAQLRRLSHAPENLRRRQTVLGGFGPARPPQPVTPAPVIAATSRPFAAFDDDDEPTVIQPSLVEGFASAPNQVRPDPSPQRGRHPTSGNTLRIKTGDPGPVKSIDPGPVTPRAPTHDRITPTDMSRQHLAADFGFASSPRAAAPSDPDLESLPSTLLVTAPHAMDVSRKSVPPPAPTRGVMSRHSEPPGTPTIPRAALTRDPDSDAPPRPDAPHRTPPFHRQNDEAPVSLPSDAVQSVVSTSGEAIPPKAYSSENDYLPSVQVREDYAEADLARQRTRPPRSRREGWVESGTPPPIGELSDAAARIAKATSHPPYAPSPESEPPPPKSSGGKWIGFALFGIAAVAGAFALGKRAGETSTPSTVATPTDAPTAAATAAEAPVDATNATEEPAPAAASATNEPAPAPTVKVASPSPAPAKVDSKPVQRSVSPLSAQPTDTTPPSNVATATTPALRPSAEPEKPATTVPGAFDASAAANALGEAASRASSCRQPGDPSGIARVTVTFANSGNATHALVDGPPFAGTPTGGCIASTMRSATVPPFTGDRVTVKKTVVIQ